MTQYATDNQPNSLTQSHAYCSEYKSELSDILDRFILVRYISDGVIDDTDIKDGVFDTVFS